RKKPQTAAATDEVAARGLAAARRCVRGEREATGVQTSRLAEDLGRDRTCAMAVGFSWTEGARSARRGRRMAPRGDCFSMGGDIFSWKGMLPLGCSGAGLSFSRGVGFLLCAATASCLHRQPGLLRGLAA